ncbi:hypothetical protein GCM10010497_03610 [Streptomyces cinereoruber]|uniref:Uncharacterized protein n=1 Tax=Streptomyces cinereoruber TaxID=67260 RepID=A0AAV4KB23_9ACTN|nr:hypothetical protein GCM10010497_03610 [Streptomyces cinereoruber]
MSGRGDGGNGPAGPRPRRSVRFRPEPPVDPGVRSVKFCVRTAHSRVTQKYDGGASLQRAWIETWEAA